MGHDMDGVYREHARTVYNYLLRLCRHEGWAEELTQETFYRAVYSIHKYNGSCKMSVWLCQIAKHVWYQELSKRNRRHAEAIDDDHPDASATPEEQSLLAADKMELYRAIHTLEEPMREVVHLRLSGEFSFLEIAQIMGKSENWARVTFYRAKQKIIKGASRL